MNLFKNLHYLYDMGMSKDWQFEDVIGLEPELLGMVTQPVAALMLLFPLSEKIKEAEKKEVERIEKDGNTVNPDVYFMKQFVGNACGTVGLLHAVLNNQKSIPLDGTLRKFADYTKDLTPEDRGHRLEEDEDIHAAHEKSAQEGQTEAPPASESVQPHFVALVNNNDTLYELDGRKAFPISHGSTSADSLLQDAAKVCKRFMELDPSELRFTVMALVPVQA
ncbi:ubiquitin carboxyl-terminal hydrolase isozyme L3-like isoform X2 [Amphiura filiformis]|uniref:ubiquitin carboxyl-terminal hydrolase isozyme L3-like isoform X2 n=1 Tax=Amphiura filiformis TaxID=82378 RepID=UPI003B2266B3